VHVIVLTLTMAASANSIIGVGKTRAAIDPDGVGST
jgi:hypothetical protein